MNPSDLDKVKTKLPLSASTLARNLPPPVTADACGELVRSPARAGDAGPESGSNSNARVAAKRSKRIRQSSKPLLNKLEEKCKELLKDRGIVGILEQAITLKLDTPFRSYRPDLAFLDRSGLTFIEVKGPHRFRRAGIAKVALAAKSYPQFRFVLFDWIGDRWKEVVLSQ